MKRHSVQASHLALLPIFYEAAANHHRLSATDHLHNAVAKANHYLSVMTGIKRDALNLL